MSERGRRWAGMHLSCRAAASTARPHTLPHLPVRLVTLTLPATPGWWLALHAATRDLGVPMDWERRRDVVTVELGDVPELAVRIAVETYGISEYELRGG